jgi:uncharacterized membrane protein
MRTVLLFAYILVVSLVNGFTPHKCQRSSRRQHLSPLSVGDVTIRPSLETPPGKPTKTEEDKAIFSLIAASPIVVGIFSTLPADAADGGAFFPIASALVAYVHYIGLFTAVACLVAERLIISRDNFGEKDEDFLTKVDIAYGLVSIPIFVSGYLRVMEYGKGFDFYKNEPFFWVKVNSGIDVGSWYSTFSLFLTMLIVIDCIARNLGIKFILSNGNYNQTSH